MNVVYFKVELTMDTKIENFRKNIKICRQVLREKSDVVKIRLVLDETKKQHKLVLAEIWVTTHNVSNFKN